jgi:hypothetical protein
MLTVCDALGDNKSEALLQRWCVAKVEQQRHRHRHEYGDVAGLAEVDQADANTVLLVYCGAINFCDIRGDEKYVCFIWMCKLETSSDIRVLT